VAIVSVILGLEFMRSRRTVLAFRLGHAEPIATNPGLELRDLKSLERRGVCASTLEDVGECECRS
jgi:hypothetical protein